MKRIKNYITSALGLLIIVFGGVLVWCDKIAPLWFIGFAAFGVILFRLKDPDWLKKVVEKIIGVKQGTANEYKMDNEYD